MARSIWSCAHSQCDVSITWFKLHPTLNQMEWKEPSQILLLLLTLILYCISCRNWSISLVVLDSSQICLEKILMRWHLELGLSSINLATVHSANHHWHKSLWKLLLRQFLQWWWMQWSNPNPSLTISRRRQSTISLNLGIIISTNCKIVHGKNEQWFSRREDTVATGKWLPQISEIWLISWFLNMVCLV